MRKYDSPRRELGERPGVRARHLQHEIEPEGRRCAGRRYRQVPRRLAAAGRRELEVLALVVEQQPADHLRANKRLHRAPQVSLQSPARAPKRPTEAPPALSQRESCLRYQSLSIPPQSLSADCRCVTRISFSYRRNLALLGSTCCGRSQWPASSPLPTESTRQLLALCGACTA